MVDSEPMMSGGADAPTTITPPSTTTEGKKEDTSLLQPHGSVEMKPLDSPSAAVEMGSQNPEAAAKDTAAQAASAPAGASSSGERTDQETDSSLIPSGKGKESSTGAPAAAAAAPATTTTAAAATTKARSDSLSIDRPDAAAAHAAHGGHAKDTGIVCNITLLLPTGARYTYRIDEKYLTKRNVEIPELTEEGKKDPFSISVYKLKELILREWREQWEAQPASPSSIRLIHFGKLLEDKEPLKKYHFSAESPNVVHMSVRPAEMMEEDEAAKGKSGGRDRGNRDGGSGCCVIL